MRKFLSLPCYAIEAFDEAAAEIEGAPSEMAQVRDLAEEAYASTLMGCDLDSIAEDEARKACHAAAAVMLRTAIVKYARA